jgi:FKBP-type peptidyl-prolyl cis-trans isomerase
MKRFLGIAATVSALTVSLAACQSGGEKNMKLETKQEKSSYALGRIIGQNIHRDSIALSPEAFLRGVQDAAADTAHQLMSEQQTQEAYMEFQHEMSERATAKAAAAAAAAKAAGDAFLAENAKKPGVVVLPSGLQYKVITAGKGAKPKVTSTVVANYKGSLVDGKVFDTSYGKEPVSFPVSGVIKGWTEALQLMSPGAKWELYIPSDLAYGDQGAGQGVIPGGAALIFEVELISVK